MKTISKAQSAARQAGFSLLEIMVVCAIMTGVGGAIFYTLSLGLSLFARNTAINLAHQNSRLAIVSLTRQVHSAISVPKLVNSDRTPASGSTSAGISFQTFAAGPFQVPVAAAAGATKITFRTNGYKPVAGQHICLPQVQFESDITAVAVSGANAVLTLATPLDSGFEVNEPASSGALIPVVITGFISQCSSYVVIAAGSPHGNDPQTYNLVSYQNLNSAPVIVTRNIVTEKPFTVPATAQGQALNQFVSASQLETVDTTYNHRDNRSINILLDATMGCRAHITYKDK